MEPRKLRLLLIIGIAAMVVAIICLLNMNALMGKVNDYKDRQDRADAVLGTLTWDDILAQGDDRPAESASAEASEGDAEPSDTSQAEAKTAAPSEEAEPSAPASAAPASETLAPADRPVVLVGGGLVPYDNRKFEITPGAVPEAGFAKVITITREGQTMRTKDITWEVDVPDSDDVHVTMNGARLSDNDTIGTGALVEFYDGDRVIDTAVVVLPGDVTGTGKVDASQLSVLQKAVTDPGTLTGAYFLAGDLDGSGTIDEADVALLQARVGTEG